MNKYIPYWSATAAGPFTCLKNGVEVSPLAENDQEKFLNGGISYFLRLRCYNISPLYLFYSIYIYYSTIEILSLEVSHNISYFPPLLVTHHDSVTGDNCSIAALLLLVHDSIACDKIDLPCYGVVQVP